MRIGFTEFSDLHRCGFVFALCPHCDYFYLLLVVSCKVGTIVRVILFCWVVRFLRDLVGTPAMAPNDCVNHAYYEVFLSVENKQCLRGTYQPMWIDFSGFWRYSLVISIDAALFSHSGHIATIFISSKLLHAMYDLIYHSILFCSVIWWTVI